MDIGLWVVLGIVLLCVIALVAAVVGTVDTFQFESVVWAEAGYARTSWMWQAALVMFLPGALVYSGIYYLRIRPRLVAAQRRISQSEPSYPGWAAHRRWYDRFSRARRSPYDWEKAARRWWMWIPSTVVPTAIAIFYAYTAGRPDVSESPTLLDTVAALFVINALQSAVRCGLWYSEHMRLTGRRPERGGPLLRPRQAPTGPGLHRADGPPAIRPKTR